MSHNLVVTPLQILKHYFGYATFRPGQTEIIDHILTGRDCLALLPTGGGKSLCFQVPGLCLPGTTIVVSPLISLMKDQVDALRKKGISARYLNSSLSRLNSQQFLTEFRQGSLKFMYVAPERLRQAAFLQTCQQVRISLVVVDEAHCLSEWGDDFRPAYLKIKDFVSTLKKRPVVAAFTATATPQTQLDIQQRLDLLQPYIYRQSFFR